MDMILIKILAAFLALSQVTTRPEAIRTQFDPARDRAEVVQIMRDGCGHFRKAFDVESIDLDDLIKTAMDDPSAFSAEIKSLHGVADKDGDRVANVRVGGNAVELSEGEVRL